MSLVSTKWLNNNKKYVKIIDSSWHLPNEKRDSLLEFNIEHIPNAIYFDIDKNSDHSTDLPHMLPSKKEWEKTLSTLGISNKDKIIIYDDSKLVSSCRLWYTFLYFGHDKNLVFVLNGGLAKWKSDKFSVTSDNINLINSNYVAKEKIDMVKNLDEKN